MARKSVRSVAVVAVLAVVAGACGKDREAATPTTPAPTVAVTTAAPPVDTDEPAPADTATDDGEATTPAPDTAPPTTIADVAMFGDSPWPCGPGDGANTDDGSEVGVTADSINIGTGDDAGYAGSPGLNHEMTDAIKALVSECNDLGGISGRTINLNYFDAKLFEVPAAMQSACDGNNFVRE